MTQLAIIKLFEIIGEAAYQLDKSFKNDNDHIEWRKIEVMRHILVQDYFLIQPNIIWNTKDLYLPDLIDDVKALLAKE